MPQITLEYSDNLERIDFSAFFKEIHEALAPLGNVAACKSRAIALQDYVIGEANNAQVLLLLRIGLLAGRSLALKEATSSQIVEIIKKYYLEQLKALNAADQARLEFYELGEPYIMIKP